MRVLTSLPSSHAGKGRLEFMKEVMRHKKASQSLSACLLVIHLLFFFLLIGSPSAAPRVYAVLRAAQCL